MYRPCGASLRSPQLDTTVYIDTRRSKCRCYTNGVATNTTLVFVIFTNGESCFVVERSVFEMVDRFCRSS